MSLVTYQKLDVGGIGVFDYRFTLLLELCRFDGKNVIRRASFPREKLELSE